MNHLKSLENRIDKELIMLMISKKLNEARSELILANKHFDV